MSTAFLTRRAAMLVAMVACVSTTACRRAQRGIAPAPAADAPSAAAQPQAASQAEHSSSANSPSATSSGSDADAARRARERAILQQVIHFQFDRSDLDASARSIADAMIEVLRGDPTYRLRIEGHADERGSDEYNLALAMRRAAAVQRYLANGGIESSRLEAVSLGEERPVCVEPAEGCWQRNRRAEFVIRP